MVTWKKQTFSFSRAKNNYDWYKGTDDAKLDYKNSLNEDCTFISHIKNLPLICCDGVGGSIESRKASFSLTSIFSKVIFEDVNKKKIIQCLKSFQKKCSEKNASTTCIAIWHVIKNNILYLKVLQLGDGLAYLSMKKNNNHVKIINLCRSPSNLISVSQNSEIAETSDELALIELASNETEGMYFMNIPVQVSPASLEYENIFFSLGQEFDYSTETYNIFEGIELGYFYYEEQYNLEDIQNFEIIAASDGISDNINNYSLYQILTNSDNKAKDIFSSCLINFDYTEFLHDISPTNFIDKVLSDIPFNCHNAIMDIYHDILTYSYDELYQMHKKTLKKINKCLENYYILYGNYLNIFSDIFKTFKNQIKSKEDIFNLKNIIKFYDFIFKNMNICKTDDMSIISIKYSSQ